MDAVVRQMRDALLDTDLKILAAVNQRLTLAARLESYAAGAGREGITPEREEWMRRYVASANRGPLSPEGLDAVFGALAEVTRREAPGGPPPATGP